MVKAGDELNITYIDNNLPRAARIKVLSKQYHFTCGCERCDLEKENGSGKISYRGGGPPTKRTNAEKKARRAERNGKKKVGGGAKHAVEGGSLEDAGDMIGSSTCEVAGLEGDLAKATLGETDLENLDQELDGGDHTCTGTCIKTGEGAGGDSDSDWVKL